MLTMRQEFIRQRVQVARFNQIAVPVHHEDITLHEEAASVLERACKMLAKDARVPHALVTERLFDFVYRLEPSGMLFFVLYVPEREMEITIELPSNYWKFIVNNSEENQRAYAS